MSKPRVSVVMSIYNGADVLGDTIDSVLAQTFTDFEFIIINDGSTDKSRLVLERYRQADSRIKLHHQQNTGLSKALSIGCQLAKGELIARQDNGDLSLPERLAQQVEVFEQNPNAVMVSSATRFVGPAGEHLDTISQSKQSAKDGLKASDIDSLKGPPHHGSVMFDRSRYEAAGGYREMFLVAQDIDLWSRMVEVGDHLSLSEVLYQAGVDGRSISFTKREQQILTVEHIIECIQARKHGMPEAPILKRLEAMNHLQAQAKSKTKMTDSAYYYFLGSNLLKSDAVASRRYFREALRYNPTHWRAMLKLLRSLLKI